MDNRIKNFWNLRSDDYYKNIENELCEIENNPEMAFPLKVREILKITFPDLKGKKVCVPSSGDNLAVYAFYLLGAQVTSCDISENQINNVKKIAENRGFNIEFIVSDTMTLDSLGDRKFDLVHTSNGAHIWISDLNLMYKNINRILVDGGSYIFYETHPMNRPFSGEGFQITVTHKYDDIVREGEVPNYCWRMADFINAAVHNGFSIHHMDEYYSSPDDFLAYDYMYTSKEERIKDGGRMYNWKYNPYAAFPQCFDLLLKKT